LEKTTYYVSVQADTIQEQAAEEHFEFEIEATPEEIDKLQELFAEKEDAEDGTFWRAHVPFLEYHNDEANDQYDKNLKDIYQMIHQLGCDSTKKHIESMGILQ
jgi:hypothetical protein